MEPCDELKWKKQAVCEYLTRWVTGWIELVDEDKKKRGWGDVMGSVWKWVGEPGSYGPLCSE